MAAIRALTVVPNHLIKILISNRIEFLTLSNNRRIIIHPLIQAQESSNVLAPMTTELTVITMDTITTAVVIKEVMVDMEQALTIKDIVKGIKCLKIEASIVVMVHNPMPGKDNIKVLMDMCNRLMGAMVDIIDILIEGPCFYTFLYI